MVLSQPILELADALRQDAKTLKRLIGDDPAARIYEKCAERIEDAVRGSSAIEWINTDEAAALLDVSPAAIAARCRRKWKAAGLAYKEGGTWFVHTSVLPSCPGVVGEERPAELPSRVEGDDPADEFATYEQRFGRQEKRRKGKGYAATQEGAGGDHRRR
jgi:hypothetical protein